MSWLLLRLTLRALIGLRGLDPVFKTLLTASCNIYAIQFQSFSMACIERSCCLITLLLSLVIVCETVPVFNGSNTDGRGRIQGRFRSEMIAERVSLLTATDIVFKFQNNNVCSYPTVLNNNQETMRCLLGL